MAEGYCQVLRNRLCEGTCPRTTGEPSGPPPGMRSPSDVGACASRRSTDRCRVCPRYRPPHQRRPIEAPLPVSPAGRL